MSNNITRKTKMKTTATQTDEIDATTLEIARLEEQVKLLSIENGNLRKCMTQRPSGSLKNDSPIHNDSNGKITRNKQVQEETQQYPQSSSKRASILGIRGCSCKGNCDSKRCGCVRKDNKCGESCNCDSASCQNQQHKDKETNHKDLDNASFDECHTNVEDESSVDKNLKAKSKGRRLFSSSPSGTDFNAVAEEKRDTNKSKNRSKRNVADTFDISTEKSNSSTEVQTIRKQANETNTYPNDDSPKSSNKRNEIILSETNSQKEVSYEPDIFNDNSFDPTKPRRQLTRTPTKCGTNPTIGASHLFSPEPVLNVEIKIEDTEDDVIPTGFTQSEIDWEQHQSLLVSCKKCNRKFHPLRVKKHELCCKKI